MSPFDFRGPEFLAFYLLFGVVVLVQILVLHRVIDPVSTVKIDMSDPYAIAFLRGGKNELIRVATISLIRRKLLQVEDTLVSVTTPGAADSVRIPIERQLLLHFANTQEGASAFSSSGCAFAAEAYAESLEKLGLLPDETLRNRRSVLFAVALLELLVVAFIKIAVALARGHTNIGFLIILAFLFSYASYKCAFLRLTASGRVALEDLRYLFDQLNNRPPSDLSDHDIALLAAVFGFTAVPEVIFPYAATLYPKASKSLGSSCGAGCGASGCGGGCGGGGCGGGCGGCGG